MTEQDWEEYLKRSKTWAIRVGFDVLHSLAFAKLNYAPTLKVLSWFHEKVRFQVNKTKRGKGRYQIINGGEMVFTYAEAKFRGLEHRKFSRALKELVRYGFIDVKKHGSGLMGDYSIFTLSGRWRHFGTPSFQKVELPTGVKYGFQNRKQRPKYDAGQRPKCDVGNRFQRPKYDAENGIFTQSSASKIRRSINTAIGEGSLGRS